MLFSQRLKLNSYQYGSPKIEYKKKSNAGLVETDSGFIEFSECYSGTAMNIFLQNNSLKISQHLSLDSSEIDGIIAAAILCGIIDNIAILDIKQKVKSAKKHYKQQRKIVKKMRKNAI